MITIMNVITGIGATYLAYIGMEHFNLKPVEKIDLLICLTVFGTVWGIVETITAKMQLADLKIITAYEQGKRDAHK